MDLPPREARSMASFDFTSFDGLGALVIVLEAGGAVVHWNRASSELTGYSVDDVRGKRLSDLLPAQSAARLRDALAKIAPGGGATRIDVEWDSKTGERRTIALSISVPPAKDGSSAVVLTGIDVTHLAKEDAAVTRLRALLEQAPDGIFVAGLDGRYTDVNEAGCRLLGYSRDEIVGKSIVDLLLSEDAERLWESRKQLLAGKVEVSEWMLRRKDGSFVPVEVSAKILSDGQWQGVVRDLSERRRLEKSLRESHSALSRAQAVAKTGTWRLDVGQNELAWSDEAYRIFGIPRGTPLTYEVFLAHVHPEDRAYVDRRWNAALRGEPYDIEHRIVVHGEVKWVREKADIEFDAIGALRRGIGIVQDITEQHAAMEERHLWQERLQAIISIAADAIISTDDEGRILVYNEGAQKIFGWSRQEVLGKPLGVLFPQRFRERHRHEVEQFGQEPLRSRQMGERGVPIIGLRKSGEEFAAEAAIAKVEVAGKRLYTVTLRDITDRIAVERERERLLGEIDSERRWLRTVLDIVPMGILFLEPNGRLYFNRRTEELLGMTGTPGENRAIPIEQVLFPDGRPVPAEERVFARIHRGETIIGEEYLIDRPDGVRIPVLGSAAPLRDAEGRVSGAIAVFQDISDRMRAEEALRMTEQRLSLALRASPAVVSNQDLDLRYTWIHNLKEPLTANEVLGKTDLELPLSEGGEQLMNLKRGVLESETGRRDVICVRMGSEVIWYDLIIEPLRDGAGRIVGVTCAGWDITEQRRMEEAQRFLAEVGAVLMTATPDYEATLTELARIGVRELADWFLVDMVDAGRVRRLRVVHSAPSKADVAERLERVMLDRERPHLMFSALHTQQAMLVSDVTPSLVESFAQSPEHLQLLRALDIRSLITAPLIARGRLVGAFAMISSRESRRYEPRDLWLAEEIARVAAIAVDNAKLYTTAQRAIAARDEVLGMVAHDLRNPLNSIVMQTDLLKRRGIDGHEVIRRAALRMNRMINDILDVARIESGTFGIHRAAVAPQSLLDEVYETQRHGASKSEILLHVDAAGPLPDVAGDRDRLLQVLENLVGNAMKFTPRGGHIVIGAAAEADAVRFRVTDTGPGIPKEHLNHLFDRFWQANRAQKGAGLGLPIAKGIVESHRGKLWVESEVGRGTTFYFTIPVAEATQGYREAARR